MAEPDKQQVPVEKWVQHPASDYVQWMDKDDVVSYDELTPEQKKAYDEIVRERQASEEAEGERQERNRVD